MKVPLFDGISSLGLPSAIFSQFFIDIDCDTQVEYSISNDIEPMEFFVYHLLRINFTHYRRQMDTVARYWENINGTRRFFFGKIVVILLPPPLYYF